MMSKSKMNQDTGYLMQALVFLQSLNLEETRIKLIKVYDENSFEFTVIQALY
jgi:hypothetical protein